MRHFYLHLLLFLLGGQSVWAQAVNQAYRLDVRQYGTVGSAAVLASGHTVTVGNYLYSNGIFTGGLTRFLPTGEVDWPFSQQAGVFECGASSLVRAYPDGRLLLVGATSTQASGIMRLLPSGQLDPSFQVPTGTPMPNLIYTAALQPDGKILLAGTANSYSGSPCVLRLNADGSPDFTFVAALGNAPADYVRTLAVQSDGRILVAGRFTRPVAGLVRLLPNGQYDNSFQPNLALTTATIVEEVLCRPDGRILISGSNTLTIQGRTGGLQQLLADGTVDPAFDPAPTAGYSFVRNGDNRRLHLLRGGRLCLLPLAPAPAVVFLLPNGRPDPARPPLTTWPLSALTAATPDSAGGVLLSGTYRHRAGPTGSVVRILASGQRDLTYAPQLCTLGTVKRLLEQPGLGVVVAGEFDLINDMPAPNLARLLPGTSLVDTAFSRRIPRLGPLENVVVQPPDNALVITGFNYPTEPAWGGIVRLWSDGRLDTSFRRWAAAAYGSNLAVQADGRLLVFGDLGSVSGSGQGISRLLADGNPDPSFVPPAGVAPGRYGQVLVQPDGRLLVMSLAQVVRLLPDGRRDNSFKPTVLDSYRNFLIRTAVLQADGRLTLGGQMPSYTGIPGYNTVVRLLPNGRRDSTLADIAAVPTMWPRALCYQPDGSLLVGGNILNQSQASGIGLFQYLPDGSPDPAFMPLAGVGIVYSLLRTSSGQVWVGGNYLQANSLKTQHLSLLVLGEVSALAAAPAAPASATEVYPNPARQQVRVRPAPGRQVRQWRLLDALGRLVLDQPTVAASAEPVFDTSALPRGSYLLRLEYAQGSATTHHVVLE